MNLHPHRFLQSSRLFYSTAAVIFLLLIGVVAVFQMNSLKRITDIADASRDTDRRQSCMTAVFNLSDYSWDTFAPHVQAVNDASMLDAAPETRRQMLERLAALPGVKRVYFLENGRQLSASIEPPPAGMVTVLAGYREAFGTYFQGGERPTEKIDNMILNRVRFLNVPFQGDTLRMIVGAFN